MKAAFHKIVSITMSLVVLFSTMSFSVDMHFCGEHLVDFSLSDKVDTCMMAADMSKTNSSCATMDMEMNCCSDIEVVIEGQDDLKIAFDQLTFDQQQFLVSFTTAYINIFEGLDENVIPYRDYAPPPLIRDVQILDQTFLI